MLLQAKSLTFVGMPYKGSSGDAHFSNQPLKNYCHLLLKSATYSAKSVGYLQRRISTVRPLRKRAISPTYYYDTLQ